MHYSVKKAVVKSFVRPIPSGRRTSDLFIFEGILSW